MVAPDVVVGSGSIDNTFPIALIFESAEKVNEASWPTINLAESASEKLAETSSEETSVRTINPVTAPSVEDEAVGAF